MTSNLFANTTSSLKPGLPLRAPLSELPAVFAKDAPRPMPGLPSVIKRRAAGAVRHLTLLAAAAVGATAAHAEGLPVRVNIPFTFMLGTNAMPAGEYTFVPSDHGVLTLRAVDAHKSVMALALPGTMPSEIPAITFTIVDDEKALTLVRAPGWTMSFAPPPGLKKPLAKRATEAVTLTASK